MASFSASGSPGSGAISASWSASDHCPPYSGYVRAPYRLKDGSVAWLYHSISSLSGTVHDSIDCSNVGAHPISVQFDMQLQDGYNGLVRAGTQPVTVC